MRVHPSCGLSALLALLLVGTGCTTRFVADKTDVLRAERDWQERRMESYIPGERMDGEPTFLRMSKLRAIEEIEGDPDRLVVHLKDPKPGLLYAGIATTAVGVVFVVLTANELAKSLDEDCLDPGFACFGALSWAALTGASTVVALGGVSMIITGAVLRTPEGPHPSRGYGDTIRANRSAPGLQVLGRF